MTRRSAVFVGCRLIAVYMATEGIVGVVHTLMSFGYMSTMAARGGGFSIEQLIQTMLMQVVARVGVAVFLWAGAGKISRMAADAEATDDGYHGD